ncbi:hypothetical protein HispidOSU_029712 [Sigmodon hispidus]
MAASFESRSQWSWCCSRCLQRQHYGFSGSVSGLAAVSHGPPHLHLQELALPGGLLLHSRENGGSWLHPLPYLE